MKRLAVIALAACLGCTAQIGHLALAVPGNIDGVPEPIAKNVLGQHCQIEWTVDLKPSLEEAMRRALATAPEANAI